MSTQRRACRERSALGTDIGRIERELEQRRQRIAVTLSGIADAATRNVVSPEALLTAAAFGVMLQRGRRRSEFALVSALQMASTGIRIWNRLSRPGDSPRRPR